MSYLPNEWSDVQGHVEPHRSEKDRLRHRVEMHQRKIAMLRAWEKTYADQAKHFAMMRNSGPDNATVGRLRQQALAKQAAIALERQKLGRDPTVWTPYKYMKNYHPLDAQFMRQVKIESVMNTHKKARSEPKWHRYYDRSTKKYARAGAKERAKLAKNLAKLKQLTGR